MEGEEGVSDCWQRFWQESCGFASCRALICIWWPNTIWSITENLDSTLGFSLFSHPCPGLCGFHTDYREGRSVPQFPSLILQREFSSDILHDSKRWIWWSCGSLSAQNILWFFGSFVYKFVISVLDLWIYSTLSAASVVQNIGILRDNAGIMMCTSTENTGWWL